MLLLVILMKEKLPKLVSKINTSRTIALVLSLLLCISIIGIIASAASVTKDGLEVTLVTDKEEYSVSEPIVATLTLENKGDRIIDEVNLETLIPEGYHIESSSTATKNMGQIGIGEKAVLAVTLLPNSNTTPETPVTPGTVTPETPSDDGKVSSNIDTNKQNDGQNGNSNSSATSSSSNRTSNSLTSSTTRSTSLTSRSTTRSTSSTYSGTRKVVKNADTGDESKFVLWIILGVFSLFGLITILIQKHNSFIRNGFFSIILIASLLVGLFGMIPLEVKAEESINSTLTIAKSVNIGKKMGTVEGRAIVTLLDSLFTNENENGDIVYRPNNDHCVVDEDTGIEYFDDLLYAFTYEKLSNEEKKELAQKIDGSVVGTLKGDINYLQFKVKNSTLQQLKEKAATLNKDRRVLFASFDYPRRLQNDDNNPWPDSEGNKEMIKGDEKNPAGNDWWAEAIHAYTAWDYIDSDKTIKEPIIGILDDGFYEHEDLTNTIYYQEYSSAYPKEHGTHVAGLVGAANNSVGIRGVSDLSTLILAAWDIECDRYDSSGNSVKDKDGNPVKDNYLDGGQYVSITKQLIEHGSKVVNNSWGPDYSYSQIEAMKKKYIDEGGDKEKFFEEWLDTVQKQAVDSLGIIVSLLLNNKDDFVIVQSAGNGIKNDSVLDQFFPELFPNPAIDSLFNGYYCSITQNTINLLDEADKKRLEEKHINLVEIKNHTVIVGAVKNEKNVNGHYLLTNFSNYGNNVDICAPGDDVLSTVSNNGYEKWPGTSMAAPIVSGAISVLWGMNPSLSAGEIKQLVKTTDQYGIGVGLDSGNLYPMLNLAYAIEHSPYYEKLKDDEQPSTPGDISGIDDPEPSSPSEPTVPGDVGFASGKGTKEDPYVIMTPEQLNSVRYHLDASFVLGRDIDMSAWENWEPIGSSAPSTHTGGSESFLAIYNPNSEGFGGSFDGNGYTIESLSINTEDSYTVGLFGFAKKDSTLKNIKLKNIDYYVDKSGINYNELMGKEGGYWSVDVGGLVSFCSDANVDNCEVSGRILTVDLPDGSNIGGIIGSNSSHVSNLRSSVNIGVSNDKSDFNTSPHYHVGGIIGYSSNYNVSNCVNGVDGDISVKGLLSCFCGGINGYGGRVANCKNYGDINCKSTSSTLSNLVSAGGIVGKQDYWEHFIASCVNYGNVAADYGGSSDVNACFAGGIIGYKDYGSLDNCFNMGLHIKVGEGLNCGTIAGNDYFVYENIYSRDETKTAGIPYSSKVTGLNGEALPLEEMEKKIAAL